MADNVPITAGSGTSIATDDVGGNHLQIIKVDVGAGGASSPVIGLQAGVPIERAVAESSTGSWTSATAGDTAISLNVEGLSMAFVFIRAPSTLSAGVITFEYSEDGGSSWGLISGQNSNIVSISTSMATFADVPVFWRIPCAGCTHIRARLSTVITGAGTTTVLIRADSSGQFPNPVVRHMLPPTGTQTTVAASASSVSITVYNPSRFGCSVYNDSTVVLYLRLSASAASTSDYTVQIPAKGYYEVPFGYCGAITGIWASATGNARVTTVTST